MKRIISALFTLICIVFLCCGCNNEGSPKTDRTDTLTENPKDNELLPFNLKFGMTEEEATQVYKDFPTVNYGDYETFYQIDGASLYADMINGNGTVLDPNCQFYFNENNELYELSVKTTIYDGERAAEILFNEYVDFFQLKLGISATTSETSNELLANIETETLSVRIIAKEDAGDFTVSAITCCKVYQ